MPRRLSAAGMLAGAAPGREPDWKVCWTVRRLQARIAKRGPTIIGPESRVKPCGLGGPVSDGQGSTSFGAHRLASARSAQEECAERLFIVSLFQTGGSRVTNLGHPAYPRSKDTGDHNLLEKRGQAKSASRTPRKTRAVRPKLHCLKSNPDRGTRDPAATLTQRGVTVCRGFVFCSRQARTVRYRGMIPGVGMSGRPNPRSDVR